jgi:xanthosine utilization system XapX-like protein
MVAVAVALLYFSTAAVVLLLLHRFVTALSRGAAIALLLVPLCFTGRAMLTGRVYAPVDLPYGAEPLQSYRSDFHIGEPHDALLSDVAYQIIPWREAMRRSILAGEWPLWNRFMLCGDILAATMQPAAYHPIIWLALLLPTVQSFTFSTSVVLLIAAIGAFAFARQLGCREPAALIAAAAWAFCAPVLLLASWFHGVTWAMLPLVLLAAGRIVAAPNARHTALLTIILVLEVLGGHPETNLHVVTIGAAYGIFEMWRQRRLVRPVIAASIGGVLALLICAIALLPFFEALPQTMEYLVRAKMYAYSALPANLWPFMRYRVRGLLLPRADVGSIALVLAVFALFRVRSGVTWFFAVLFVFGFLAGHQVWPLAQLLHALPLFDITLNDRLIAAASFGLAMLAGIGAEAIAGPPSKAAASRRTPKAAFAWLLPLLLAALAAGRVARDGGRVPALPPAAAYPPVALYAPMASVREPFRIVGTDVALVPNTATMYGLEDVRGYAAMTLRRYTETYPLWCQQKSAGFNRVGDLTRPMLSMMNVRFAIARNDEPIPDGWRLVTIDRGSALLENTRVLPRAFVPRRVRIGSTAELEEMAQESDFAERAWLTIADRPHERINGPGNVRVRPRRYGYDLDASMASAGWVVISQAAWKGWRAYVDGRRVEIQIANHAFLSVYVPEGRHQIRFIYRPASFVTGRAISAATAVLLAIGASVRRFFL